MLVLFVSSGNSKNGISPIIKSQGDALIDQGVIVKYFTIKGRGTISYLKNIRSLRNKIKSESFDIIHAHYSLSAFLASLLFKKPLIVSLMGSDLLSKNYYPHLISLFSYLFNWNAIIVKSDQMKRVLNTHKKVYVIPNGVNTDIFKPMDKKKCRNILGWDQMKYHILFAADKGRLEKNYQLFEESFRHIDNSNIDIHSLNDIPHYQIPFWINASDVVVLTSHHEGSPNVLKEAMACSIPIVSTKVGDVEWLFGKTMGHYIGEFNPEDFSQKLKLSLEFCSRGSRTNGKDRIYELGLNSAAISHKISSIYNSIKL